MLLSRVWLMLTERCNLKCAFCYQKHKGNEDITSTILEDSITFILKESEENVEIMLWGGEPLLRFDLIQHIVKKYPQLNWRFATNGFLLTKPIMQFLYKHRDILGVCLSVETGASIPPTFGLEKHTKQFVHIIATNTSKIIETITSLYNLGFRSFQVSLAHAQEYTEKEFNEYESQLKKLFIWFSADLNKENGIDILNWGDMLRIKKNNEIKKLNFCGAGCSAIAITPKGEIYPCDWFYSLKNSKLGNIYSGFDKECRQQFLNINKNRAQIFKKCQQCSITQECGSHMCLAENLEKHGDMLTPVDTTCRATILERSVVLSSLVK